VAGLHCGAGLPVRTLKSFVLEGEACACDESGWPDFNALLGGGAACATACFHAFDLLELDGVDLRHLPFSERYAKLARSSPRKKRRAIAAALAGRG